MREGCCPRCGAVMASAEYLGELAADMAARPGAASLLEAVRCASPEDVQGLMARMEQNAPGLAAALGCYVGTCGRAGFRSEARVR